MVKVIHWFNIDGRHAHIKIIEDSFLWDRMADDLETWHNVYSIEYSSTSKFV